MEGLDGIEKRRKVMSSLRENPPAAIGGYTVSSIGDYMAGVVLDVNSGNSSSTGQPSSDVLYYTLESGDKIIVRPSGTEPKIKIYILLHSNNRAELNNKAELLEKDAKKMMEV